MAVQKMQVVVHNMHVFVLLLKQETDVRRKGNANEKVRFMPWKAGTRSARFRNFWKVVGGFPFGFVRFVAKAWG